jgi:hypothetical protein
MPIARFCAKTGSLNYPKILSLLLAVVLAAGCIGQVPSGPLIIQTATGPVNVNIEVADTDSERAQGLMNRASLAADAGMLFVFDDGLKTRNFWMKDTLIPLDILFIAGGTIVDIQTMVPCTAEPCPIYSSRAIADSALEVNAGFAAENGVNVGDAVSTNL